MSLKKYVKFLWILRSDKVFSEKQKNSDKTYCRLV